MFAQIYLQKGENDVIMFGFFRKKENGSEPPLKKKIKDMKCRRISYVDTDLNELEGDMRQNAQAVLKLTPVNYYAVKNSYISALIYTSQDYEENYIQFKRVENEHIFGESEIYPLDKQTVSKALAKVGIIIDPDQSKRRSDGGE